MQQRGAGAGTEALLTVLLMAPATNLVCCTGISVILWCKKLRNARFELFEISARAAPYGPPAHDPCGELTFWVRCPVSVRTHCIHVTVLHMIYQAAYDNLIIYFGCAADMSTPQIISYNAVCYFIQGATLPSTTFQHSLVQVLGLMEAAAEVLSAEDVRYDVCRRLAGLEPFVEFATSDPATRGALLGACFRVLDILSGRGLDVRPGRSLALAPTCAHGLRKALPVSALPCVCTPGHHRSFPRPLSRSPRWTCLLTAPPENAQELGKAELRQARQVGMQQAGLGAAALEVDEAELCGARQVGVVAGGITAYFNTAAQELDKLVLRLGRARRDHTIAYDQPLAIGTQIKHQSPACMQLCQGAHRAPGGGSQARSGRTRWAHRRRWPGSTARCSEPRTTCEPVPRNM